MYKLEERLIQCTARISVVETKDEPQFQEEIQDQIYSSKEFLFVFFLHVSVWNSQRNTFNASTWKSRLFSALVSVPGIRAQCPRSKQLHEREETSSTNVHCILECMTTPKAAVFVSAFISSGGVWEKERREVDLHSATSRAMAKHARQRLGELIHACMQFPNHTAIHGNIIYLDPRALCYVSLRL